MAKLRSIIIILVFLLIFSPSLSTAVEKPGNRDRCPVCGMFVAPYPSWLATIAFNDGSQLFFDGPKDLFRFYLDWPAKESRQKSDITAIYVTEYYSTRLMKIAEVLFVTGSDVYGPMGQELVPVAGREAAAGFMRDHRGTKIITFEQVSKFELPAQ
ncbi:MAG: nitrous oxide reductase accessory protein NosL [Thermodesulfobacteriota bacterium]